MSTQPHSPFARLPELQKLIRQAVEDRDYPRVLSLIEEQQAMFHEAGRGHPKTSHFAHIAHELTVWALTMVRLQRAHTESRIRQLSSAKRIADSYHASLDPDATCGDNPHSGTPFVTQG